jgi:hypothetical protein
MSKPITMWGYAASAAGREVQVEAMSISALVTVTVLSPPKQRPTDVFYFEHEDAAELVRELTRALEELEPRPRYSVSPMDFPLGGASVWVVRDRDGVPVAGAGVSSYRVQADAEIAAAELNRQNR